MEFMFSVPERVIGRRPEWGASNRNVKEETEARGHATCETHSFTVGEGQTLESSRNRKLLLVLLKVFTILDYGTDGRWLMLLTKGYNTQKISNSKDIVEK